MVILDVTHPALGRFFVHDNYTLEEVLLVPGVYEDSEQFVALGEILQQKRAPYLEYLDVLQSSLSVIYGSAFKVTVHTNNQPELERETAPEEPEK